LVAQPLTLM